MLHSPQKHLHINLFVNLLPGFLDLLAVIPIGLTTGQQFDPVVNHILDIRVEMEVLFFDLIAILQTEHTFAHEQLIPILIKGGEKNSQKTHNNAEKPSHVR